MTEETNSESSIGPLKRTGTSGGLYLQRRRARQHGKPPEYSCACGGIHESQVRLGWKCSIYTPPSRSCPQDDLSRRIPDIWLDLPCAVRMRLAGEKRRRRLAFSTRVFSSLSPRRVIAVAHSHRVLATGPCWHSFFQRHVTDSAALLRGTGPVPRPRLAKRGGGSP